MIMRILVVMAHPDDAEIWSGGTILKHTNRGDKVKVLTFCLKGNEEEIYAAANILGYQYTLSHIVLGIRNINNITNAIKKEIIQYKPNIIIAHWDDDTHPAHQILARCTIVSATHTKIYKGYPDSMYQVDTYKSQGMSSVFQPNYYIDVTDVWELKCKSIKKYESQNPAHWIEMAETQNKLYGIRCKVKFAEGFRRYYLLGSEFTHQYLL